MSKPRKPDSRRPSKKKLQKMEQKRKADERMQKFLEEEAQYTRPTEKGEDGIKACKQRVKEGKLCYCKSRCRCRGCQERNKENGGYVCSLKDLKEEGGCAYGCSECSECRPCYENKMKLTKAELKVMLEIAPSVEEADKLIKENCEELKTYEEKIEFLHDMFGIETFDKPDEMTYFGMLNAIIQKKFS